MEYNYNDNYFNPNKGTKPPQVKPNLLGQGKEFLKKVIPKVKVLGSNPSFLVPATALTSYQIGTALDNAFGISENIADRIMPRDGKYNPNRAPNPAFTQAMENQQKMAGMQELAGQQMLSNYNEIMDQTGAPGNIAQEGFNVQGQINVPGQQSAPPLESLYGGYEQSPIGIMTQELSKLREQGVSDEERTAIAAGMMRPYMTTSHEDRMAQNKEVFDRARADYETNFGMITPKVGGMQTLAESTLGRRPGFNESLTDAQRRGAGGQELLSIGDYKNMLRDSGFSGSGLNTKAKQLYNEQLEKLDDRSYERMQDQINLQREEERQAGIDDRAERQITLQERIYEDNLAETKEKAAELSEEDIRKQGIDVLSKLQQGESISNKERVALYAFREQAAKNKLDDPLDSFNLDSAQEKELLAGSGTILPSFTTGTKENPSSNPFTLNALMDAKNKGFESVIRDGVKLNVDEALKRIGSKEVSTADKKGYPDLGLSDFQKSFYNIAFPFNPSNINKEDFITQQRNRLSNL